MSSNTSTGLFAIETSIYNALLAERQSGRLTGVAVIGKTWLNEVEVFPSIGITYDGFEQVPFASSHDFKLTHNVQFILAAESDVSFSAAKTQADQLMDDGNGNGLIPVLTDPNNHTWGNTASRSQVTRCTPHSNLDSQKRVSQYIAYWVVNMQIVGYLVQAGMYK